MPNRRIKVKLSEINFHRRLLLDYKTIFRNPPLLLPMLFLKLISTSSVDVLPVQAFNSYGENLFHFVCPITLLRIITRNCSQSKSLHLTNAQDCYNMINGQDLYIWSMVRIFTYDLWSRSLHMINSQDLYISDWWSRSLHLTNIPGHARRIDYPATETDPSYRWAPWLVPFEQRSSLSCSEMMMMVQSNSIPVLHIKISSLIKQITSN